MHVCFRLEHFSKYCSHTGTGELLVKAARAVRAIGIPPSPASFARSIARANEAKACLCKRLRKKEKCSIEISPENNIIFVASRFC